MKTLPCAMSVSVCCCFPTLLLLLLLLLLSPTLPSASAFHWQRVTPSDPSVYSITYHTPDSLFAPGCARTFTFASLARPTLAFNVTVHRLSPDPLISSQTHSSTHYGGSLNLYNFNAAYVPLPPSPHRSPHALLVRAQNATALTASAHPDGVASQSRLFLAYDVDGDSHFADVTSRELSFHPVLPEEEFGTEDPRIVWNPTQRRWYLFYSAVRAKPAVHSDLWVASTPDILDSSRWTRHGPVCTDGQWSKSGALLLRPNGTSYLYFGDSNNGKGMLLATTENLINYTIHDGIFLPIRPAPYFDNQLVEGGPPPEVLNGTGYIFYVHNSAGVLKVNGSTYSEYHVAFVLLSEDDPTRIVFRTPVPILNCEMGWEIGLEPWLRLTPYVVFTEGMRRYPEGGEHSYLMYYGGADSVVGAAVATLTFYEEEDSRRLVAEARRAVEDRTVESE